MTASQFHRTAGLEDWRVVGEGVCAHFRTGSFAAGLQLVNAIGDAFGPEHDGPTPDVDLRDRAVTVRVFVTPDLGLGPREVELTRRISQAARELGLSGDPSAIQTIQVSIDALVRAEVTPFWRALLGWVERDGPEDLADPHGRGPAFYFQQMDEPRPQRNRIHIDVYVPYDQAQARVTAALAAGGSLVTEKYAPHWWVLADPEGNEACVATFGGPDPAPNGVSTSL